MSFAECMFGLFKSKPYKTSDKIWMTAGECWKGLATDAMQAIVRGETPLVLGFFEDVASQVQTYLESQGVPVVRWEQEGRLDDQVVIVADAHHAEAVTSSAKGRVMTYLFAGHHPMLPAEDALLEKLSQRGARHFNFYLSLDSPLLEVFGSENLRGVMDKLGIKQDECIEHAMVTRSIQRAREKITGSVINEHLATSERDWYLKNVKKK